MTRDEQGWKEHNAAITALRAALAQQAEPVQEPEGMVEFLADLQRSRTKYPKNRRMFDGLMGEIDELRRAYAGDGDIRAEAFDVAVCAFRIATEGDAGGSARLEQAEPAQAISECLAVLRPMVKGKFPHEQALEELVGYTAPPQRKLVLLTAQELDGVIERHVGGSEITDDMYTSMEQFARAVEKASWEKNHGQT